MANHVTTRTISECIEQLIISNIKLTIFDHQKAAEVKKEELDLEAIAKWEIGARQANERRAAARSAIDQAIKDAVEAGEYDFPGESRTF